MSSATRKPGSKLQDQLSYPPRGMRAERAAAYLGVGTTTFLEMVADGTMPKPRRVRGMNIWDRLQLDAAFEAFHQEDDEPARKNTVDQLLASNGDGGAR